MKEHYLKKIAKYQEMIVEESAKTLTPNQPKSVISESKKKIHCYKGFINQMKAMLNEDTN